jgi:steroid delta-isomerase-like uncharacterized protein
MTTIEKNKAIAHRLFEEVSANKNLAVIDEIIDQNITVRGARGSIVSSRDEYKQFIVSLHEAFPDVKHTVEELIAEGDKVMVRWRWRGTHQGTYVGIDATGKYADFQGITILKIVSGKIVEDWVQADVRSFLEQVGVVSRAV